MKIKLLKTILFVAFATTTGFAGDDWKSKLQKELPLLGHRNWIVVAERLAQDVVVFISVSMAFSPPVHARWLRASCLSFPAT